MTDIDIWRAARVMIDIYELDARWNAGLRADHLLGQGDLDGFHVWVRIGNAISVLQQTEPIEGGMSH